MMFVFPIQGQYKLTQKFGQNMLGYERFGLVGHNGYDYACVRGTPIIAPDDGTVVWANKDARPDAGGYGNEVRLLTKIEGSISFFDHVFAHLLTTFVEAGQEVKRGQVLGLSDSTGFSTGDHLHWGVREVKRIDKIEGVIFTTAYLGKTYLIPDYNNGYFGYFDQQKFFEEKENHANKKDEGNNCLEKDPVSFFEDSAGSKPLKPGHFIWVRAGLIFFHIFLA